MRRMGIAGLKMGMLGTMLVGSASAAILSPNDDAYIDESSGQQGLTHDAPSLASAGLVTKNQTGVRRAGFMEYTIPNIGGTATLATFNLTYFRSFAAGLTGAWTFQLGGSTTPTSFDETTLTWTNAVASGGLNDPATHTYDTTGMTGASVALSGGNGTGTATQQQDVFPNVAVSVDITGYFNAHQGQTVVFKLTSTTSTSNTTAGGTFQDREQSRVMTSTNAGGAVPNAPFISYVPEPAAALLLIGTLPMLRRRNVGGRVEPRN